MFSKVMLLVISAFVIGVVATGFVFSQGVGFSTSPPSSGVYHDSTEVVCDNCISSSNLASNSVNSIEITDGQILNQDISDGAAIRRNKLYAYKGHFIQGIAFGANQMTILPGSSSWGVTNWNSKRLDILCDTGPANDADLFEYAGVTDHFSATTYEKIYNHYIAYLFTSPTGAGTVANIGDPAYGWVKIYDAYRRTAGTSITTTGTRALYARPNPSNAAELQVGQIVTGAGLGYTPSYWTCLVDYNTEQ